MTENHLRYRQNPILLYNYNELSCFICLFTFLFVVIGADPLYQPVVTSYDYDAPLTEAGDITDKYMAIRELISQVCNT